MRGSGFQAKVLPRRALPTGPGTWSFPSGPPRGVFLLCAAQVSRLIPHLPQAHPAIFLLLGGGIPDVPAAKNSLSPQAGAGVPSMHEPAHKAHGGDQKTSERAVVRP